MFTLENILPIVGIAMCICAVLPLALWSVQSLTNLGHNRKQFQLSQQLLREQILAATKNNGATSQPAPVAAPESAVAVLEADEVVSSPLEIAAAEPQAVAVADDGTWRGFRDFRVTRLEQETPQVTSVYLQPVDGLAIADFQPGQHLPLRFAVPGQTKPVVRCYSLSDGPGKTTYRISVKATQATPRNPVPGLVSNYVNSQLQVGDVIQSRQPSGTFVLDAADQRPAVMLAGGIGITPMISMIDWLAHNAPDRIAILVYGVRNKAEQAFADQLQQLAAAQKNLHVVYCYSAPGDTDVQGTDYQVQGFVNGDLLRHLLPNNDCQYYLCGPPPFMESLFATLSDWGVPEGQVFSEAFGPASIGKAARPSEPASVAATTANATVTFGESGKAIAWNNEHDSLLELAEANGIEIDSGCRAGSCGTCATRLLSGAVAYPDGRHVDCEPGECLTCVARPDGSAELGA